MISIYAGALILAGLFTLVPGPAHARRPVRVLKPQKGRFGRRFFGPSGGWIRGPGGLHQRPPKSMKKRREKPLARDRLGVVRKASIRYMILSQN